MSDEFKLVLLGAGILTTGYFLWPEPDPQKKADEAAQQQVAGNNGTYHGGGFIFISRTYGQAATRPNTPGVSGGRVSRGGFGSLGRGRVSG